MVYYACGDIIINAALGQCTEVIVVREVVHNKALVLLAQLLTLLCFVPYYKRCLISPPLS